MAKFHLDRIKKKYGWRGGSYRALMRKIIDKNSEALARATGRISKDNFAKAASRYGKKAKTFVLPDITEAIPKRSVFSRKAAEKGKLMTDKLRDRVTKSLRETLLQFSGVSGQPAFILQTGPRRGRINPKLVEQFKRSITSDFSGYTRVDPSYGVPTNIQTIAVAEVRSIANEIKAEYTRKLILANGDNWRVTKTWVHNKSLSQTPRPHHMAMNGKTVGFYEAFALPNGVVMMHPHDPNAPAEEVYSCHCDFDIKIEPLT